MQIFVTGAAGFIGFHVVQRLLEQGHHVVGYDGVTDYYDVQLKSDRLSNLQKHQQFQFIQAMLEDRDALERALADTRPDAVIHLAAQAGVRYAFEAPDTYISSNILGTFNLLETLRKHPTKHLLFASTSSVYGGNVDMPFKETDRTDYPVSLYAATKKAGEAMAHSYAHLFDIPTTAFRFFTVYGPWGRPDMALFKFVRAISNGDPIEVYGGGEMRRDFTYIDDLVNAVIQLVNNIPIPNENASTDSLSPVAAFRTINIAGGNPVGLLDFIDAIESKLGLKANKIMLGMQPGDVVETYADPTLINDLIGWTPSIDISMGVGRFVDWYRSYYGV